jgi:translation initiation factor IF-2
MKASTMLEHDEKYGVVLAFDVPVTRDAQELADSFKPPIKVPQFMPNSHDLNVLRFSQQTLSIT